MSIVATFVWNGPSLPADAMARAAHAVPHMTMIRSLGPQAFDLVFDDGPDDTVTCRIIRDQFREALSAHPVDVIVQPAATRRKQLFLADMDSTIIQQECIDELADMAGVKCEVAAITDRAMRGEIEFEPALRERLALLKGLPAAIIEEVIWKRITYSPGAKILVSTLRAHGIHTCLVSGGFTAFTSAVADAIGFDEHHANVLESRDGILTGTVREPILGREAKRTRLLALREEHGVASELVMAVGDGANDLAMLAEAGIGVAYHAKPAVAAAADASIAHTDLTTLLYAQGFTAEEFVLA